MKKFLIIGLDGATWNILTPLIHKNNLPTLKKLIKNGTYGVLESTIPPVTGGAWVSIATGKTPGKTGIIDFLNRKDKSKKLYPVNSEDFKGQAFWDYLSMAGIRVGIFNYPMLFPPYRVNGFMVSGLGASPHNELTFPKSLKQELIRILNNDEYEIYIDYHNEKYDCIDTFLRDLNRFLDKFEEVIYYIVSKKSYDLLFLVFSVTDWIQHIMWRHIDKTHPLYDSKYSPKYKREFVCFWQRIDSIIGKIFEILGEDVIMFIISDHGFGPNDQTFNLFKWLESRGYLVRKKEFRKILRKNIFTILSATYSLLPNIIKKYIPIRAKTKFDNALRGDIVDYIDFNRSKSYCLGHTIPFGAIYINSANKREREIIKTNLISDLHNLGSNIGKKIEVQIYETKKIYSGDKIDLLPDIIFTINNWRCVIIEDSFDRPLYEEKPFSNRHTGSHRLDGIFLAYGSGIKKGCKINGAKVYDIAPTILHMFGLPIPNDMDGKVLKEIFERNSNFAKRRPKYVTQSYYNRISEKQKIKAKLSKIKTTKL